MDLFAEIILDHYKNPRNFQILEKADLEGQDSNPLCGDKLHITIKVDENETISSFGFDGEGCAISVGAMSILSEEIIGKSLTEVENFENEALYDLIGVEISPGRVKCALLGLSLIKKLIKIYHEQKK
ncbi:Fe-S cluster protein [Candidatus Peregrinibacteria bacterium]|nr:Fe-S cluster protein [Candidatus Peregrinibacteria bacterium]